MSSLNASIRSRGYLPHWESDHAAYFVTFRLADSLPQQLLDRLRQERAALQRTGSAGILPARQTAAADARRLQKLNAILRKAEQCLDNGLGACYLRDPSIAKIVVDAILKFREQRYDLFAWCVMPNHVHALLSPRGVHHLEDILHSWKSYSANAANRVLRRTGAFWHREYFDHLVRNEFALLRFTRYIELNPHKARLNPWPWVSHSSVGILPARRQDGGATKAAP